MHRLLSTELCRGNDNYFGIALPDEVLQSIVPTSVVAASTLYNGDTLCRVSVRL